MNLIYASHCCSFFCGCLDLTSDDQLQLLSEITSLMDSLPIAIRSRMELLNKAKDCAKEYKEAFDAASATLTAARKQQTEVVIQHQVSLLAFSALPGYLQLRLRFDSC